MKLKYSLLFFIISYFSQNETASLPPESKTIIKVKEMCTKYTGYKYKNKTIPNNIPGEEPIFVSILDCAPIVPLVTGGKNAKSKEFPHMALIGYGGTKEDIIWNCGGSLISEQFVLSAAHCNYISEGKPKWVRLGELDLKTENKEMEDHRDYKIIEIRDHPEYSSINSYNDITLYKLHEQVTFNAFIRPLCLYPYDTLQSDVEKLYVTGWGANMTNGNGIDILQKARVNIVETKKCENTFNKKVEKFKNGFLPKLQLCAGDLENGADTCQGDSGTPLQVLIPNVTCMFYQIGITSIGVRNCGDKTNPGVYTNVGKYLDWIQEIVWPD